MSSDPLPRPVFQESTRLPSWWVWDRPLCYRSQAKFSPCMTYRYHLLREWGGGSCLTVVMLNPSTADHERNDPTVRKCMEWAHLWGHGRMRVVNLFALRSTDPRGLTVHADPIGPHNDDELMHTLGSRERYDTVLFAWGATKFAVERGAWLEQLVPQLANKAQQVQAPICCVGLTKDGHPGHPLYLPTATLPRELAEARRLGFERAQPTRQHVRRLPVQMTLIDEE